MEQRPETEGEGMGKAGKALIEVLMRTGVVVCSLAVLWSTATFANAKQQDTFEIVGVVRDGAGNGVAEVSVRLRANGDVQAQERKTDSAGGLTPYLSTKLS